MVEDGIHPAAPPPLWTKVAFKPRWGVAMAILAAGGAICGYSLLSSPSTPSSLGPGMDDSAFIKASERALGRLSTHDLLASLFVYECCSRPWVVNTGIAFIKFCDNWHLSFLYAPFARVTFFHHFCGGKTVGDVVNTVNRLKADGIRSLLAYSKEHHGEEGGLTEDDHQAAINATMEAIEIAREVPGTMVAVKLSAMVSDSQLRRYNNTLKTAARLTEDAKRDLNYHQLSQMTAAAKEAGVPVVFDAEQTYYRHAIDAIIISLAREYNTGTGPHTVYNTYQLYLQATPSILREHVETSLREGWGLGAKLVRGAYMSIEPEGAVWPTKATTDQAYDTAVGELIERGPGSMSVILATHNHISILNAVQLLSYSPSSSRNRPTFAIAQLYGMSDDITYALPPKGFVVYKWIPFAKVEEAMPYLVRRAEENGGMMGGPAGEVERRRRWAEVGRRVGLST
ncbi:FAD-linked oxidoreductase [Saitoella complicata NRRL Y-17804]|nr:FAD-linked oxidoreductase [Saitoella complicata NRRL Y-17804]ODQ50221.1 FAD-linked oxidoreductase [Saitoella complicata NRRL Y-17804]